MLGILWFKSHSCNKYWELFFTFRLSWDLSGAALPVAYRWHMNEHNPSHWMLPAPHVPPYHCSLGLFSTHLPLAVHLLDFHTQFLLLLSLSWDSTLLDLPGIFCVLQTYLALHWKQGKDNFPFADKETEAQEG